MAGEWPPQPCPLTLVLWSQALLKKVKEAQEGRLEQNVPSLPALVEAEKADVLCLQVWEEGGPCGDEGWRSG